MRKMRSLLLALAGFASVLTLAQPALAQDRPVVYFGFAGGNAQPKEDACLSGMTCDRRGQIWGGFGGIMFNRHFGVEAGYRTLGKIVEQDNPATGDHMWVRTRAGDVVGIAALPIEKLTVYGKFGGFFARSRLTSSSQTSDENTSRGWTYGAGLSYDVFRHVAVRLDWQRFNNLQAVGFTSDVEAVTLGALVKF
jgi:opacity protein-like surface antigen